jgi:hypothetical protein
VARIAPVVDPIALSAGRQRQSGPVHTLEARAMHVP